MKLKSHFLLILSLFVLAGEVKASEGLIAGISVGYEIGNCNHTLNNSNGYPTSGNQNISFKDFKEEIFLGFGKIFNKNYYAIEAFLSASHAKGNSMLSNESPFQNALDKYRINIKKENSYGIQLKTGYLVKDNFLLYLKLGILRSRFRIKIDSVYTDILTFQKSTKNRYNKEATGVLFGGGPEIKIMDWVSGILEFCHNKYDNIKINNKRSQNKSKLKIDSSEIKLGLLFYIKS